MMEVYDRGKQYYFCINGMQQVSATPITFGILDMFTTVYIGNSHTKIINGKMVTPRGYKVV